MCKSERELPQFSNSTMSEAKEAMIREDESDDTEELYQSNLSFCQATTFPSTGISLFPEFRKTRQDKTTLLYFAHNTVDRPGTAGSKS